MDEQLDMACAPGKMSSSVQRHEGSSLLFAWKETNISSWCLLLLEACSLLCAKSRKGIKRRDLVPYQKRS
jgi:hypothetical protein